MSRGIYCILLLYLVHFAAAQPVDSMLVANSGLQLLNKDTIQERNPIVSYDGSRIFFSRDRCVFNFGLADKADIWSMYNRSGTLSWGNPMNLGAGINSLEGEYPVGVGLGQSCLYFLREVEGRPTLYRSEHSGRIWLPARELPVPVDTNFVEILDWHIDAEESVLLWCARHRSTPERSAIYFSLKKEGVWGSAQKLPSPVNGLGEIVSAFLAADGKTLYFSANGLGGFGGFDLFVSRRLEDDWLHWSTPQNLGPAINSEADEQQLCMPVSGDFILFTSNRSGRSKIYQAYTPISAQPEPMLLLSGKVYNAGNEAEETIIDIYSLSNSGHQIIKQIHPQRDGSYWALLSKDDNIGLFAKRPAYFSDSKYLKVNAELIEPEDYEAPAITKALKALPKYTELELEIEKSQLNLNRLDSFTAHLEPRQSNYFDQLSLRIQSPEAFATVIDRNWRSLYEIRAEYNKKRQAYLESLPVTDSLQRNPFGFRDSVSLRPAYSLRSGGQALGQVPNVPAHLSFEELKEISYDFVSREGEPANFKEFSKMIERRLHQKLLPEVLQQLEKELLNEELLRLKTQMNQEERKLFERGEKELVKLIKDKFFSKQLDKPINRKEKIMEPLMLDWQKDFEKELQSIMQPDIQRLMVNTLRPLVQPFISNLMQLQRYYLEEEELKAYIDQQVSAQIEAERAVYEALPGNVVRPPLVFGDTITLSANFNTRIDLYLKSIQVDGTNTLNNIFFIPNGSKLIPYSEPDLERLAATLKANPDVGVQISVHTNGYCTYTSAQAITQNRAQAIADYLQQQKIDPQRIRFRGEGKSHPLHENQYLEGRKLNQRVEISFFSL